MQCTQCQSRQAALGTLCEECVEGNRRRMEARDADWVLMKTARRRQRASWLPPLSARWFQGGFLFLIFFLAFGDEISFLPQQLARTELSPIAGAPSDPCADRPRCFVVVVAPWCPACHGAIGFLRTMRDYAVDRGDLGVQIIVSHDKIPQLETMADEIGGPVYLDPARAMRGSAVPRWWVIVQRRKVLTRGSGLPGISEQGPAFFEYVKRYMKL